MDNTEEKKAEAPKVDTPPAKSFFDQILEANQKVKSEKEEEKVPQEAEVKTPEVNEEAKKLQETLGNLVKEEESEMEKMKALLPNTKDEAKKLEIERSIFEKEKKISKLKESLNTPVVIDTSEVDSLLAEMQVSKEGESYKVIEKMKSYGKNAPDLLRMFSMIAKAIKADMSKPEAPVKLDDKPKDNGQVVEKNDNPSLVDQIMNNLGK